MADILTRTFVSFFAIYGLVFFLREIINSFFSSKRKLDELVVVVKVKNSEKTLEVTVRMILWKCLCETHGGFMPNILIVDMGSSDSTPEIAERLCKDYSFIDYKSYDEYSKSKKEF